MKAILTGLALLAFSTPAAAETWNAFSNTARSVYMADVDSIVVEGDVTRIQLAIVPLQGEAADLSHTVDTYEFRCGANQWRSPVSVEYGPDGAEVDRYPEDGEWLGARATTIPGILKQIACNSVRYSASTWPTVRAFIEAGRPAV